MESKLLGLLVNYSEALNVESTQAAFAAIESFIREKQREAWEAAREAATSGGKGGQIDPPWWLQWDSFEQWEASLGKSK